MTYFSLNSITNLNFPFGFVPGAFLSHTMQSLPISRDSFGEHFGEENEKKNLPEEAFPQNGQIINAYHTPTLTTLARCCRHADWPSARPSTIPVRSSRDQTRASCKTLRNWISPKITAHGSSLNQHPIVDFWHFQFHHHHRTQSWEWQLLNQNKKEGLQKYPFFAASLIVWPAVIFIFGACQISEPFKFVIRFPYVMPPDAPDLDEKKERISSFSVRWSGKDWIWKLKFMTVGVPTAEGGRPDRSFGDVASTWLFLPGPVGSRFLHLFGAGKYMNIYYSCRCHSCVWFPRLLMGGIRCTVNLKYFF